MRYVIPLEKVRLGQGSGTAHNAVGGFHHVHQLAKMLEALHGTTQCRTADPAGPARHRRRGTILGVDEANPGDERTDRLLGSDT